MSKGNVEMSDATLRDWLASQVLPAIYAQWGGKEGPAQAAMAKRAYEMADAMLEARKI